MQKILRLQSGYVTIRSAQENRKFRLFSSTQLIRRVYTLEYGNGRIWVRNLTVAK